MTNSIFIVGTGRSGTHLLCRTLCAFERALDFLGGHEDAFLHRTVRLAAFNEDHLPCAAQELIAKRQRLADLEGKVYIDQTHPLLWFASSLADQNPSRVFVFPWRPNEQILASMLLHSGIISWYEKLRNDIVLAKYPSRFFGIESREQISTLPLEQLCLRRIVAHKRECLRLRRELGPEKVRIIEYEQLVLNGTSAVMDILDESERRCLGSCIDSYPGIKNSLIKYASQLTNSQIDLARSCEIVPQ